MVDASSFNLQPSFPIAGVAQLYADRATKEAAIRSQQQKQLVEGLQAFGTGVDSLVNRRMQMAQALAAAHLYSGTPEGQQALGTNQVTTSPMGSPVIANQTANFDPATGSVTPNQGKSSMADLATTMMGLAPKDLLDTIQKSKETSYKPQEIAIQERRAKAEEENNQIQRMIQGMLARNTIENQAKEQTQKAENAAFEANKETAKHYVLHPFAAYKANKAIQKAGQVESTLASLPKVGETITHSSGVKITRRK